MVDRCINCGAIIPEGKWQCKRCNGSVFSTAPRNKFGAVKTELDGIVFDSKLESKRYAQLKLLQECKVIKDLKTQVKFEIVPKSKHGKALYYVADFTYEENCKTIVEDTKSEASKTPLYKLKKRLVAERYDVVIKEITKKEV